MQSPGWTDEPVTDEGVDRFGREGFAIRAAQLIAQAHSANSSTVFGLTGSWGSGKTSLINLIEHALVGPADPVNGHGPVDQEYAVVWFTPWATHDVSGLFGEFFSSLTTLFPAEGKGKNARRAFATLFRIAAPTASVIPIVGGAVAEAATVAAEALVPEMPWDEAFKEATDHIRDSGKRSSSSSTT